MRISDWSSDVCSSDLALDDGQDDRVLVLEVAVDQARAHLGGLGDAGHARGVEAVFDEALLRRAQDPLALSEGAEFGLAGRAACVRVCVHRLSSCLFAALAPRMPGRGAWCQPIPCVARSIMFRLRCDDGGFFPLTASAPHAPIPKPPQKQP